MLKIDIPDKGEVMVAVSGSGETLIKDLILAVNRLYIGIHRYSPRTAHALKLAIQALMADDASPVWEVKAVNTEVSVGYVREVEKDD